MNHPARPPLRRLALFGFLSFATLAAFPARAALVAHDNFNSYASADPLSGLAGGYGWSGAWSGVSGVAVSSETISYTLDGEQLGGGLSLKIAADSTNALVRAVASDSSGTDYFVSFVFQIKGGTTGTPVSGTYFAGWQADDATPSYLNDSIGYVGASSVAGARVQNTSTGFATALNYGQTYLFVIKYTGWSSGTYTKTQVWLNPTRGDEATTNTAITRSQTVATTGAGSAAFNGLRVRTSGLASGVYQLVDDLRVGTTWDDVVSPGVGSPVTFSHPGITVDSADLARIRARLPATNKVDPQALAWVELAGAAPTESDLAALLAHTSEVPSSGVVECVSGTDYSLHHDARALLNLALAWSVTQDSAYADKAIEIMNSWSSTLTEIKTATGEEWHTHVLHTGWTGHHFAEAAEIIRHTYLDGSGNPIWAAAKITDYENMLKTVFYPNLLNGTTQNGNWEASIIHSILAIGIFTDDHVAFDRGTLMLRGAGRGAIGVYIYPGGCCQETNRDRNHPQLGIGDILEACEMAWKQGVDIYSAYPDASTGLPRMALGLEFMTALLDGQSKPVYDYVDGHYIASFSYASPKNTDVKDTLEVGYNHYRHRVGYTLPWTHTAVTNGRIGGTVSGVYYSTHGAHNRSVLTHGDLSVERLWSPFSTGSRQSLSNFGWSGWGASGSGNATDFTTTVLPTSNTNPRLGVHNVAGAGGSTGVLFAHSGNSTLNDRFVVAKTFADSSSGPGVGSIKWTQAFSNVSTSSVRVLVKVGGQWYASWGAYTCTTNSSAGSMTNEITCTLDLANTTNGLGTAEWSTISYGTGAPINRSTTKASSAISPDLSITGIGLLITTDNVAGRVSFIDDIKIIGPAGP